MHEIVNQLDTRLSSIDIDKLTRAQATTLLALMRKRIHVNGLASDGRPIGTYTKSYMKYVRPKFGRKEGSKVVLSLTRSMENSMILFPIENGTAIGYATAELTQRARWQEKRYDNRPIFSPTQQESDVLREIAKNYINEHFSQ